MAVMYCAFWYPTIYHRELRPLTNEDPNTGEHTVKHPFLESPTHDHSSNSFHIRIDPEIITNQPIDNMPQKPSIRDLRVTCGVTDGVDGEEFSFCLNHCDESRNGFVVYKFDTDGIPASYLDLLLDKLKIDIYHLAKRFYHEHEAAGQRDSALKAIVSEDEILAHTLNNQCVVSILSDYSALFNKYAHEVSRLNRDAAEEEKRIDYQESYLRETIEITAGNLNREQREAWVRAKQNVTDLWDNLNEFQALVSDECENALIEYTYYQTLINSRYNNDFTTEPKCAKDDTVPNERRRHALNIENSIRYVENIRYKNQNRYNRVAKYSLDMQQNILNNSERANQSNAKLTVWGICLTIVFGITSVAPPRPNGNWTCYTTIWVILFSMLLLFMFTAQHKMWWPFRK